MTTIDGIAQHAGAVELQATYGAAGDPVPWAATISTYEHGRSREPGSMTGIGEGIGRSFDDAVRCAAENYRENEDSHEEE